MPRYAVVLLLPVALAGCAEASSEISNIAAVGIAAAVGSATGSALIGIGAGIGASYAIDQGVKYGQRRIEGNVQNAIAAAAGPLEVGQAAPWQVAELLPLSGRSGTVQVARSFGEQIPCKDVVFTVGEETDFYVTTICQGRNGWRWAIAEPAVPRWGSLQ